MAQFLDDCSLEACHVMINKAAMGLVTEHTLYFQIGGAFPGSHGGPHMFRNKAVALYTKSTSLGRKRDSASCVQRKYGLLKEKQDDI